MVDFELLSYKEIADRLGIKLASARQTVSRRKWQRVKANDGSVRIKVPLSYLQREASVGIDVASYVNVDVDTTVFVKLQAENEYLKQRVSDLESDRDSWRSIAQKSWWQRFIGA